MIFWFGTIVFLTIGAFLSIFLFRKEIKDRVSSVIIALGCLCIFIGITNSIIINYIPPIEIKETSYKLVECSDGSYINKDGNDYYIKIKTSENKEKQIRISEKSLIVDDNDNPPFVIVKENVYPDYFNFLFTKGMYPKTYEIHI